MEKLVLRNLYARARVFKVSRVCFNSVFLRHASDSSSSVDDVCESKLPIFKRILMTGIQPTGIPHVGNYFGSIKQCKELQDRDNFEKLFISIADLHSITLPQNPHNLRENIMNLACALLACGLDKQDTVIFLQSSVPQHTELAWILGCLTTMNKLDHLPQWKEGTFVWQLLSKLVPKLLKIFLKAMEELVGSDCNSAISFKEKLTDKEVPLGLYMYPILQAADVLIYKATDVPVGEDQIKHMELARQLAKIFNRKYKHIFPLPRNILGEQGRLKSLRDPLRKMSKSEKDSRGRIELFDSPDEIREKLRKAVTDTGTGNMIGYDSMGRPGISNLIDIYAAFEESTPDQICSECATLNMMEFKDRVAECIIEKLRPIRAKIVHLKNNPEHVMTVLERGNGIAQQAAYETCAEVKKLVGFA